MSTKKHAKDDAPQRRPNLSNMAKMAEQKRLLINMAQTMARLQRMTLKQDNPNQKEDAQ